MTVSILIRRQAILEKDFEDEDDEEEEVQNLSSVSRL